MKARIEGLRCIAISLAAATVLWGCVSGDELCGGSSLLGAERWHAEQRGSLSFLYFAGNPLPPDPTEAELAALADRLAAADPEEAALLRACYGDEQDLLVYATRDSDGDGIHDYRVSDYYGKLLEGDVDVDGDGTDNVLDAEPYDAARGGEDANRNRVPDHIDWSLSGRSKESARRQRELAERYGFLLVDRSAEFDDSLARSTHDVLSRVYRSPLASGVGLPALRVIAAEETCLLDEELDDGTNGVFVPQTRSLTIYRIGLDAPPFVQLGLLTHELGHAYQFSLDFDSQDPGAENVRVYYPAPAFHAAVQGFGWSVELPTADDALEPTALYSNHYLGVEPSYRYQGWGPEEWAEWLQEVYAEKGGDYLADPRVAERGIMGDYSTENPWEWYSDGLIAYLFTEMEAAIGRDPDLAAERDLLVERMRAWSREAWPAFRYRNLSEPVREHLRARFPIAPADLDYLVGTYVRSESPLVALDTLAPR